MVWMVVFWLGDALFFLIPIRFSIAFPIEIQLKNCYWLLFLIRILIKN